METFAEPRELIEDPRFPQQRRRCLGDLRPGMIDAPIADLIDAMNALPYCFTMQCCYGHFVYAGQPDPHSLEPLPAASEVAEVEYRIAYVALCVENSEPGRALLEALSGVPAIDPENIQFGSADWFWRRQPNSYALQVEPDRCKNRDTAMIAYREALRMEKIRHRFFDRLDDLVRKLSEG